MLENNVASCSSIGSAMPIVIGDAALARIPAIENSFGTCCAPEQLFNTVIHIVLSAMSRSRNRVTASLTDPVGSSLS